MTEKTIALPFSIDPYGKVTSSSDQSKIWGDKVRSVIGTTIRERIMRPEFGTKIAFKVFDTEDEAINAISTEVTSAFNTQLPLLKLIDISSVFDEYTGTISTDVTYSLPNDVILTTAVGLVYIAQDNPPVEENI